MTSIRIDVSTRVRVDNLLAEAKTAWVLGNTERAWELAQQAATLIESLTNKKAPAETGA
jgi:hypothetical protein